MPASCCFGTQGASASLPRSAVSSNAAKGSCRLSSPMASALLGSSVVVERDYLMILEWMKDMFQVKGQ
eukprot:scaffold5020_cov258-Pinguiococcus_pyrenoidosus.AAC.3